VRLTPSFPFRRFFDEAHLCSLLNTIIILAATAQVLLFSVFLVRIGS
jgi:hypothetical protein